MTATLSDPLSNQTSQRLPEAPALCQPPAPGFLPPIESATLFYLRLSEDWRSKGDDFFSTAGGPNELSRNCYERAQQCTFTAWKLAAA